MSKDIKKLENEIQELAKMVDKVEDEKLEVTNQLKKALADYANLERDLDKRTTMRGDMIKVEIAKALLKVMDDIHFALKNAEGMSMTDEVNNWVEGVKNSMSDVQKTLSEFGIESIEVNKGDVFDSTIHEAVTAMKGGEKNTVLDVMQPGFILGDIVIRPARVVISLGQ